MGAYTPRANLYKPGGGSTGLIVPDETVDIDKLNANFDKLDALLGARNIPSASSYAGTMDGDLVFAQDTEYLHMYSASAAALVTPRLPGAKMFSGTRAEREAFAAARTGDLWRDTDNIGIIWAFKAGSPGTWEWVGNELSGLWADIAQTDTDNIAKPGMRARCTDDGFYYVRDANRWVYAPGQIIARYEAKATAAVNVPYAKVSLPRTIEGQKLRFEHFLPASIATAGGVANIFLPYKLDGTDPVAAGPYLDTEPYRHPMPPSGGVAIIHTIRRFVVPAGATTLVVSATSSGTAYSVDTSRVLVFSE